MKTLDAGHIYELKQLGDDNTQTLIFIKRSGGAVQYEKEWAGLQTQKVLRALIDRTKYLYEVLPCKETEEALRHLRMALFWYEARAYRRKQSATNRTTSAHDDTLTVPMVIEYPSDVPFMEVDIELRATGEDGHIIL
jgi:hypothetical protein